MKPRRIPARAEKVYTYNLSRDPKNDRKQISDKEVGLNRFDTRSDENKPGTKVNYELTKKNEPREKVKAISNERLNQKKNSTEIFSWGDTDDQTESFYEAMQEHEVGDPNHEEQPKGHAHKTHSGEDPLGSKQNFLNQPEEKFPTGTTENKNSVEKQVTNDFTDGDQKSTDAAPLA